MATIERGRDAPGDGPDCDDEDWPGPVFVCVTRYIVGEIAVGTSERVQLMIDQVMDGFSVLPIPPGSELDFVDDEQGMRVSVFWDQGAAGDHYALGFHDATTDVKLADWDWTLYADGSASGTFRMLGPIMQDGLGPVPDGLHFEFEANADGTEKTILMDIDLQSEPPQDDRSAPTSLRIRAEKTDGDWTVQYGMYHPYWFSDPDYGHEGIATYTLVSAVGGVDSDDPAVMKVIALPGDMETVPPDPDEDYSICDYTVAYFQSQGWDAGVTCDDNNPIYVFSDNSVLEGGEPLGGFEQLAAELALLPYIVDDPRIIRDLVVDLSGE
jgi:hypothetical protein